MCRMVFLQYSSAIGITFIMSLPHFTNGFPWIAYDMNRAVHRDPKKPRVNKLALIITTCISTMVLMKTSLAYPQWKYY